jgi:hypothetical protein
MHPVTSSVPDLPSAPEPDIHAALIAPAHRPQRPERRVIDLAGLHLTGAALGGANLTGARLGGANLTRAWFKGANLTGARFRGAEFTGAWLPGTPAGWERDARGLLKRSSSNRDSQGDRN